MESFISDYRFFAAGLVIGIIIGILIMKLLRAAWNLLKVGEQANYTLTQMDEIKRRYSEVNSIVYEANRKVDDLNRNLHTIKKIEQIEENQQGLKREQEKIVNRLGRVEEKQL